MATGNDIISYKGDANKALAGSPGALSVAGDTNTTGLSQTARDVAMMSFNANQIIFKQKIADRDAAFKLLDENSIVPDQILEDDRARINGKIKKLQDIFYENSGDIMSDPKKYREFIQASKEAAADTKQAQKWYIGEKALLEEKQKYANNPIEQAKYDAHRLKMRAKKENDFNSLPDPFVPTTNFNLETTAKNPITRDAVTFEGEFDVTTTTLDTLATFNDYQQEWSDPTKNHWFSNKDGTGYVDMFLNGPKAKEDVARINRQLEQKNIELGLKPGDPGYLSPLGVQEDPATGAYVPTSDRPDQLAAKIAMADTPAVNKNKVFSEKRAGINVEREGIAQRAKAAKDANALGWGELNWEKDKWEESQKGGETVINDAAIFAKRMYDQVAGVGSVKLADGSVVLTPEDIRRGVTAEHLKYMGTEGTIVSEGANGEKITTKNLNPATLGKNSILIIKDGVIRVMDDAWDHNKKQLKRTESGKIRGTFNPNQTSTIGVMGTNRINEQLTKAGSKELSSYSTLDRGLIEGTVNSSGGSQSASGGSSGAIKLSGNEDQSTLIKGRKYILDGVEYEYDGKNLK